MNGFYQATGYNITVDINNYSAVHNSKPNYRLFAALLSIGTLITAVYIIIIVVIVKEKKKREEKARRIAEIKMQGKGKMESQKHANNNYSFKGFHNYDEEESSKED